nr:GTP cyclohydrolase I [Stigmatella erecta]
MGTPRAPRRPPREAPRARPDAAAMAQAVKDFLRAAGLPLETDLNLQRTPTRVAEVWMTEFLDGYALTPEEAIGAMYPAPPTSAGEMVVVTDLRFHSMCPHHLLPYEGRAHLAYVPGKHVVGFGRLGSLLNCFAHRLILQEDLARCVAGSMARVLGSPATACILEAKQACMRLRGGEQRDAVTHVEAYEGRLRKEGSLRRELWARLGALK